MQSVPDILAVMKMTLQNNPGIVSDSTKDSIMVMGSAGSSVVHSLSTCTAKTLKEDGKACVNGSKALDFALDKLHTVNRRKDFLSRSCKSFFPKFDGIVVCNTKFYLRFLHWLLIQVGNLTDEEISKVFMEVSELYEHILRIAYADFVVTVCHNYNDIQNSSPASSAEHKNLRDAPDFEQFKEKLPTFKVLIEQLKKTSKFKSLVNSKFNNLCVNSVTQEDVDSIRKESEKLYDIGIDRNSLCEKFEDLAENTGNMFIGYNLVEQQKGNDDAKMVLDSTKEILDLTQERVQNTFQSISDSFAAQQQKSPDTENTNATENTESTGLPQEPRPSATSSRALYYFGNLIEKVVNTEKISLEFIKEKIVPLSKSDQDYMVNHYQLLLQAHKERRESALKKQASLKRKAPCSPLAPRRIKKRADKDI